jgi:hypothetical protein
MSYRDVDPNLAHRLANVEQRLRALEQAGAVPPDRGWVLTQTGTNLQWLYVPTGALGPVIGTQ